MSLFLVRFREMSILKISAGYFVSQGTPDWQITLIIVDEMANTASMGNEVMFHTLLFLNFLKMFIVHSTVWFFPHTTDIDKTNSWLQVFLSNQVISETKCIFWSICTPWSGTVTKGNEPLQLPQKCIQFSMMQPWMQIIDKLLQICK